MGFFKYEKLQIENPLADVPAMDRARLDELQRYLNSLVQLQPAPQKRENVE